MMHKSMNLKYEPWSLKYESGRLVPRVFLEVEHEPDLSRARATQ